MSELSNEHYMDAREELPDGWEEINLDEVVRVDHVHGNQHTGHTSDEEEDAESTPVELSPVPASGTSQSWVSAVGTDPSEEELSRNASPFVPDDTEERGDLPLTSRPPPVYSATIHADSPRSTRPSRPPSYRDVRKYRGVIGLPANDNDDESEGVELQRMPIDRNENNLNEDEPRTSSPPTYDVAVARVAAGISQVQETTFSTDIPVEEANRPPPNYSDIGTADVEDRNTPVSPAGVRNVERTREDAGEQTEPDVEAAERTNNSNATTEEDQTIFQRFLRCCQANSAVNTTTKKKIIILCVVLSLLFLFIVLFPFQFSYVAYYQYALVRTKSTGTVATDRVYEHGCYVLGADKEFIYLNRTVQSIEFTNLSMFTADNVALSIDVKLYYLLRYDKVGQLWRDYAGDHKQVIFNIVKTTIRNTAPLISQEEYLLQREYVQKLLHDALIKKFADWGISIPFFNYLNLHLPERILNKKLQLLLIRTDIEKELAYQKQREIELHTELLTTRVVYQAKEAINNGTARAAAIKTVSQTTKSQNVDTSHANAFASMMQKLNVTREDHAMSFYFLATLNTMDHYGGTVHYSKNSIYRPKGTS